MKKFLNISVIAALAILPMAANAAVPDSDPGVTTADAPVAQNAPKYALAASTANDDVVATAGYVKGAYNAAIKAVNKVADMATNATNSANISYDGTTSGLSATNVKAAVDELASEKADKSTTLAGYGITDAYTKTEVDSAITNNAVQTVTKGTGNGTISVDNGADVTIYDDTALANRVSDNEDHIGTLSNLQTTEKNSLVGAINEVKGTAGFAGTAAELTDTHFNPTDTTSAAKAANAAMAAAQTGITNAAAAQTAAAAAQTAADAAQTAADAAQADADALEVKVGNTTLTTTAQTLTGAIEEVKSKALTSSSLTDYAKKTGVTATISASTVSGTVPTVTTWGTETTGTAQITARITGATYAEPANP